MVLFSSAYIHFLYICSDRFLPDKAIDLIDEAGSRVRLRHAQVCIYYIHLSLLCLPYFNWLLIGDSDLCPSAPRRSQRARERA